MRHTVKRNPTFDLVTQTEAARIIGVARQSIGGMVARGALEATVVAGVPYVTRASALAEAERRAAPARAA